MCPSSTGVNRDTTSFDRLTIAKQWQGGDRSIPEPYLFAREIRALLLETTGKGRSEETLLRMAESGDIPAYQDRSRKTRSGRHPVVYLWSEVFPALVGHSRTQGAATRIVRIVPTKRRR